MSEKFKNKVVVLAGGNTGIGLASAKQFVADVACVFITGRSEDVLDKAVNVADAIIFHASENSNYMAGTELLVDTGSLLA
jgi:short-subunit dehydrogenase involved in D-alanine esterification of teichoic acids